MSSLEILAAFIGKVGPSGILNSAGESILTSVFNRVRIDGDITFDMFGIVGNEIADKRTDSEFSPVPTRVHGGLDKGVHLQPNEQYDMWKERYGYELPKGILAENLTTSGADIDTIRVGSRYGLAGKLVLEVTGPRIPCFRTGFKLAQPPLKILGFPNRMHKENRTGFYCKVLGLKNGETVTVPATAPLELLHEGDGPTVAEAFAGFVRGSGGLVPSVDLPADGELPPAVPRK